MPEPETLVTDPKPDSEAPGPPQGPPGGFATLAGEIYGATEDWQAASARVREGLKRKAEAVEPILSAAEKETRERQIKPPPPAPPLTPPPSRQLTEFLAPVEGESPTTSITKLIQAIGLFATGISGAARGDARSGLAALTGAMKGWQEGDKERADRHFADWQAKTDTALEKWKTERQTYQDIMEAANLSLDQKFKLVQLAALREDNKTLADAAEKKDLEALIGFLGQRQTHADNLLTARIRLADSREQFNRRQTELERHNLEMEAAKTAALAAHAALQKEKDQTVLDAYPPELIERLGPLWAKGEEKLTGLPRTGAGNIVRGKIQKAGLDWWIAQGRDPNELGALRQEIAATSGALKTTERNRAVMLANAEVVEKHLDTLVQLGKSLHRSGSPLANRYQLYTRGEVAGDAQVAQYQAQAYEVGQELAKLFVGTAQGDAESREEARRIVRGELNQEQLEAVANILHVNARNRIKALDEAAQEQIDRLKLLGVGTEKRPERASQKPAMPPAPPLANDPLGIRR